jgi:acetoin utilization protein AcuC
MTKAAFIYSRELEKYHYPPDHPFNVDRARKVRQVLASMRLLLGDGRAEVAPTPAKRIVLKKFHSARYLHALQTASKGRWNAEALEMGIGTADCPVFKGMYEYSALACGATLTGAKLILAGSADVAFNPSGGFHHAGPQIASGFCYINDVALACIILAERKRRVLYLDLDVHYGDGVAEAFYDRCDVMTISLHETPKVLFPGTGFEDQIGTGQGKGYCVNIPLPVGTYDDAYMKAFEEIALPLIGAFNGDVFVLQLGADALAGDPLAHLHLTNNVYADIINHLLPFNKPILATGGGGYNVDNTVRAWALDWTALCGVPTGQDANPTVAGVMLENTEWQGGLRDRFLAVSTQQQKTVMPAIEATIQTLKAKVFPIHGL